jgi:hypothetical protein
MFLRRLRLYGRHALCGLAGHDMVRHFEPDRLSLRCTICGAQTRGWTIDVNPAFRRRTAPVVRRLPRTAPGEAAGPRNVQPDARPARAA